MRTLRCRAYGNVFSPPFFQLFLVFGPPCLTTSTLVGCAPYGVGPKEFLQTKFLGPQLTKTLQIGTLVGCAPYGVGPKEFLHTMYRRLLLPKKFLQLSTLVGCAPYGVGPMSAF
jgi:hypothetical protein